MNRVWVFLLFLCLSCKNSSHQIGRGDRSDTLFFKPAGQSSIPKSATIDTSFNKLFGQNYITALKDSDHYSTMIDSADFDKDGVLENIEVGFDTANFKTKIVVYKKLSGKIEVLDSSTAMESDGRGPKVSITGDTLVVTHSFHHGQNRFKFLYNKPVSKFQMVEAVSWDMEPSNSTPGHRFYFMKDFKPQSSKLNLKAQLFFEDSDDAEYTKYKTVPAKCGDTYLNNLDDSLMFMYDVFKIGEKYRQTMLSIKCLHNH
ncbi:hypothetical protein QTN47_07950 [Danxiaibacter flavus]|uniref:Lipoprotein n=1 Tax=Danxiaibacter flavus TaxID=3049108 RepID=A0ABV3ZC17_9BACT|nr:hypothetical protein QNM32_07950 [Chitinophagaceae bacterium DXS]